MQSDRNISIFRRNLPPPLTPKMVSNVSKFQNFWRLKSNKDGDMWNDLGIRFRVRDKQRGLKTVTTFRVPYWLQVTPFSNSFYIHKNSSVLLRAVALTAGTQFL